MPLLVFSTCSKELRDCHFALPAKCEVNEGKKNVFRRPIESHGIANALLNARKAAEAVNENEKKRETLRKIKSHRCHIERSLPANNAKLIFCGLRNCFSYSFAVFTSIERNLLRSSQKNFSLF